MSLSLSNVLIGVCALLDNVPLVPVVDGDAETWIDPERHAITPQSFWRSAERTRPSDCG